MSKQPSPSHIATLKKKLAVALREKKAYLEALRSANREFQDKILELSILRRIADSISSSLDERIVCASIVDILCSAMTLQNCSVMFLSECGKYLELKVAYDRTDAAPNFYDKEGSPPRPRIRIGEGIAGRVARLKKPMVIKDAQRSKKFKRLEGDRQDIGSLFCLPIIGREGLLGVINLSHPDRGSFSADQQRIVSLVVDHAALALSNITLLSKITEVNHELGRLNKELHTLSNLDGLTNIANRRSFEEFLKREWRRSWREKQPISLIMFDVDFFKKYNDFYGHVKGDRCLKKIATALKQSAYRPGDLAARYGGEEFVLVLSKTNREHALQIASRCVKTIKGYKIPHCKSTASRFVTLSGGIASLVPDRNKSPVNLIKTADKALYQAKLKGRNRIVCSDI